MSNSKLYQPPPPPPKMKEGPVDPLMALSKAPAAIAEELTDLTDDEGLEEWAKGGTRIMPKQPVQQQPTMMAGPMPSFHPMTYSTPPRIQEKKTSAAIWVVPLALFVFAGGAIAAAAGWWVYHAKDLASSAATIDTSTITTSAPTETAPPAVTLAVPTTATVTVTATATTATPVPTTTTTHVVRSSVSAPTTATTNSNGSIRTFAAGNGKPVYVDGKQVGYGGGKITTACGHHTVGVGTGQAKSVNIPCNGQTLTVGSPDGT